MGKSMPSGQERRPPTSQAKPSQAISFSFFFSTTLLTTLITPDLQIANAESDTQDIVAEWLRRQTRNLFRSRAQVQILSMSGFISYLFIFIFYFPMIPRKEGKKT